MREYHGFTGCGSFYKGNLHSHTTISDGMLTPERTWPVERARLPFPVHVRDDIDTDHRAQFNTENFIVLPGLEATAVLYRAIGTNERYKLHHMHGILGTTEMQQNAPEGTFGHLQYLPPIKFFGQWEGAKGRPAAERHAARPRLCGHLQPPGVEPRAGRGIHGHHRRERAGNLQLQLHQRGGGGQRPGPVGPDAARGASGSTALPATTTTTRVCSTTPAAAGSACRPRA